MYATLLISNGWDKYDSTHIFFSSYSLYRYFINYYTFDDTINKATLVIDTYHLKIIKEI